MIKLTYDEWIEKYRPIAIPNSGGDIMLDSRGNEDYLKNQNPLCIWTDIDGDGANIILNGYHFVNRLAYYVTEVPFEKDDDIEVLIRYYDDEYGDEHNWRD